MRDRSTIVDLVLAFAATFVITLAIWPRTTPRQIVRCNSTELGWQTYSIAIDDPNLIALKQKVQQWEKPESHPEYVTAKWQKEVAEFYENCKPCDAEESAAKPPNTDPRQPTTATISDSVTTASYERLVDDLPHAVQQASYVDSAETSGDAPIASPSDENYWSTVKASAVASMEAVEARSANVPVVFEEITKSSWSQLAFHFAFLFGIAAACGYMHWLKFAPIRRGLPFRDQPISVLARIGTYSGTIALALISSIAVWI